MQFNLVMQKKNHFSQVKLGQPVSSAILQDGLVNTLHWLWQDFRAQTGNMGELGDWRIRERELLPFLGISKLAL